MDYIQGFLDNILLAIVEDKVNITGAFVWSICTFSLFPLSDTLMMYTVDNFEWGSGIKTRFGLQYLDYDTLERVPKASWFQTIDWFRRHGGKFIEGSAMNFTATTGAVRRL